MANDHLDKETSVSAEMTETGIKASAKSRFVAAFDRMGGAMVDNLNARIEGSTDRKRAKTKGEVKLIENIVEYGVKQLGASPEFAERAFRTHFRKIMREQENKDLVLVETQKDLEDNPPVDDDVGDISEEFFARFEPFAETASSDELRQLFGRILASEIRKPGTVSTATLRLCSVIDQRIAAIIEKACSIRAFPNGILMRSTSGTLSHAELMELRDIGFLGEIGSVSTFTMNFRSSNSFLVDINDKAVVVEFEGLTSKAFAAYPITTAGVGLVECLAIKVDIEKIFDTMKGEGATALFLGSLSRDQNGVEFGTDMHLIWRREKTNLTP